MMKNTSDRGFWAVLLPLVLAEITCAVESNMLYSALASFHKTFHDPVGVGWLITAFLLMSAAAAAVCGRLGDLFGRTRVLMIMLGVAAAGSLTSALAPSLEWIILGRALQGASMAILPLCFGVVRENLPADQVQKAVGVLGGTYTVGCVLGYVVGGVVVDRLSWPWLFWTSSALAVVALVAVQFFAPRSRPIKRSGDLDLLGGVLFVPAIAMVLLSITNAKPWGWGDWRTLSLGLGGLLLLLLWIWHEMRVTHPLIDVRLFLNRKIALGNLAFALGSFGGFQIVLVAMLFIQQPTWTGVGLGETATFAAALIFPAVFLAGFAQVWSGYLANQRGARCPLLIGATLLVIGTGGMALFHNAAWVFAGLLVLAIPAQSFLFSGVPMLIIEAAPADRTSEATGLSQVIKSVFMAIGSQVFAVMLAASTVSDPSKGKGSFPTDQAYTMTFTVMFVACIGCLVVTSVLPKMPKRKTPGLRPADASTSSALLGPRVATRRPPCA